MLALLDLLSLNRLLSPFVTFCLRDDLPGYYAASFRALHNSLGYILPTNFSFFLPVPC